MYSRIGVPVRIRRKNKQTLGPTFVQSIRFSSGLLWLCIRSSAAELDQNVRISDFCRPFKMLCLWTTTIIILLIFSFR